MDQLDSQMRPYVLKAGKGKGRKVADEAETYAALPPSKLAAKLVELEERMYRHARDLEFEEAARVRDQIHRLKEASLGA